MIYTYTQSNVCAFNDRHIILCIFFVFLFLFLLHFKQRNSAASLFFCRNTGNLNIACDIWHSDCFSTILSTDVLNQPRHVAVSTINIRYINSCEYKVIRQSKKRVLKTANLRKIGKPINSVFKLLAIEAAKQSRGARATDCCDKCEYTKCEDMTPPDCPINRRHCPGNGKLWKEVIVTHGFLSHRLVRFRQQNYSDDRKKKINLCFVTSETTSDGNSSSFYCPELLESVH